MSTVAADKGKVGVNAEEAQHVRRWASMLLALGHISGSMLTFPHVVVTPAVV